MDLRLVSLLLCIVACRAMNSPTGGTVVDTTKPATVISPGPTSFTVQTVGSTGVGNQPAGAFVPPIVGASESYPIQETGKSSGFPIQTTGKGIYQIPTSGQNSGYPNQQTVQNGGYPNQQTVQFAGYPNQPAVQNGRYPNQPAAQNGGYMGSTSGQNNGFPTARQSTGFNNPGFMQLSHNPVPTGSQTSSTTAGGSPFQSFLNGRNNPSVKPTTVSATGINGINRNSAASSITNTINGQGNQGTLAKNPQLLNSIVKKFLNNLGLTVSMGGMDAIEASHRMMASTSGDIRHRFIYQFPSYGLLQALKADPQSYNAATNYLFTMYQADRHSDRAARYALMRARTSQNPVVRIMAQVDSAAGKFGVSEIGSNAAKFELYRQYRAPAVMNLRS